MVQMDVDTDVKIESDSSRLLWNLKACFAKGLVALASLLLNSITFSRQSTVCSEEKNRAYFTCHGMSKN